MDFTLTTYKRLLQLLLQQNFHFYTFEEYLREPKKDGIILRHDVDLMPNNSLKFAQIQYDLGVTGVYYFRAVPQSWDEKVIRRIAEMGHEIGYHYESLTSCRGNFSLAIQDFETNLMRLRRLSPVSTICMHGSPMSKFDSKDLWKTYKYRDFGIIGEPYFDIDFKKVLYLTDTGRRWDGEKVSVRDKVNTGFNISVHSTNDIILAVQEGILPDQIMFTFHPQRWNDNMFLWGRELVGQNAKNLIKQYFFIGR